MIYSFYSLFGNDEAFLDQQGLPYSHDIDVWQNILALAGFSLLFMVIAYVQLRRVPKLK